jgi:hypothetical protein
MKGQYIPFTESRAGIRIGVTGHREARNALFDLEQ